MASVYTHTEAFTQRSFYTQQTFGHKIFYTPRGFNTASFYTPNLSHTASFCRKKRLHREAFLCRITAGIAAPKPEDLDAKAKEKTILKHFLKGILRGKLLAPKLRKSADKSLSQP